MPNALGRKLDRKTVPWEVSRTGKMEEGWRLCLFWREGDVQQMKYICAPLSLTQKTLFSSSEIQHRPLSVEQFSLIALKIGGVGS